MHEAEVAEDAAGEDVQFISESEPEEDLECPSFEDLVQKIQKVRKLSKYIIRKPGRLDSLKSRGVWLEGGLVLIVLRPESSTHHLMQSLVW